MVDIFANSLARMVLSPVSVLTDILAIIIIIHYHPYYHGTDMMLLSLVIAMGLNAIFVLPIPAFLELQEMAWHSGLCRFYVWCFITFRMAQILSLLGVSVHWSTILKLSAEKGKYSSVKAMRLVVIFIWIISIVIGLLPIIGAVVPDYDLAPNCKFLTSELGIWFTIFLVILIVTAMFVSAICAIDTVILIKHMKTVAEVKYQAGRFYLPDKRAGVPGNGVTTIHERYHRLNFATDLTRLVIVVVIVSFSINHLPYAILQCIQLFTDVDRNLTEVISLWLVLLDALLLPHTLWILSKRYRHALVYSWKVYVLRRTDIEEDDALSCTLQSYRQRIQEKEERARSGQSTPKVSEYYGTVSSTKSYRSTGSDVNHVITRATPTSLKQNHHQLNGQTNVENAVEDMDAIHNNPVPKQNGIIHGEVYVERVCAGNNDDIQQIPFRQKENEREVDLDRSRRLSEASSSHSSTRTGTLLSPKELEVEVKRSSSSCSRKEWKEQMRKKHLPAIFVNEGYDSEDQKGKQIQKERSPLYQKAGDNMSNHSMSSMHYYMSSDFHPDYLTDTLPRHKSQESESEGVCGQYEDGDISNILDNTSVHSESSAARRLRQMQSSSLEGPTPPRQSSLEKDPYRQKNDMLCGDRSLNKLQSFGDGPRLNQLDSMNRRDLIEARTDSFGKVRRAVSFGRDSTYNRSSSFENDSNLPRVSSFGRDERLFRLGKSLEEPTEAEDQQEFHSRSLDRKRDVRYGGDANDLYFNALKDYRGDYTVETEDKKDHFSEQRNSNRRKTDETLPFKASSTIPLRSVGSYFYDDVVEATTSFGSEPKTSEVHDEENEMMSTGTFQPSSLNSSLTSSDSVFQNRFVKNKTTEEAEDKESGSSGSTSSVTLSPYKGESRKPLWLEDSDDQVSHLIRESPDVDSDVDTPRYSSVPSMHDGRQSGKSTPDSIFDEETDRGFEEALDLKISAAPSVYGGLGLCFESIKEEPEDLTSSGSNPFLDETSTHDSESFKTHAIVSKRSDSRSTTTSSSSENPFESSPIKISPKISKKNQNQQSTPILVTTQFEHGDSGFGSGHDNTTSDISPNSGHDNTSNDVSPNFPDVVVSGKLSPWPDDTPDEVDQSFESDFSGASVTDAPIKSKVNNQGSTEGVIMDVEPAYF